MTKEVYPPELLEAAPDPANNRDAAERWFRNKTGCGAEAAKQMTRFYSVLIDANLENKPGKSKGSKTTTTSPPKKKAARAATKAKPQQGKEQQGGDDAPDVHINLQIHVSSDATPDQINKIFESMAKHIYRKG